MTATVMARCRGTAQRAPARGAAGFTLIEMMVTIAVLAILLALAVPSFNDAVLSGKLSTIANNLVASTHLARSEAIKRNNQVTLCVSTDGSTCTGGTWNQGWIVMCPTNDNVACNPAGANTMVFQTQSAAPPGFSVSEGGGATTLVFTSTGGVQAAPYTLTICRATPSVGSQNRVVNIIATGRTSVTTTTGTTTCP